METYTEELAELLTIGSGDAENSAEVVRAIKAGTITLPRCFNIRNGTPLQTARAHELARLIVAN